MIKNNILNGTCGCGNVKYKIIDKPLFTQACHCKDCKKSTGSSFVIHTMVLENDFQVNGDIASIDQEGKVEAISKGIVKITVSSSQISATSDIVVSINKKRVLSEMFTSST